ncbi:MAG: DUF134 domain-containing protein [Bacteroidales bacterium]|jgi:predicted DNA-binding protein (UPF0251 family)|nr:DUF134 domain-containing protein [Bacteroidales bacterium]MDD4383709.1 DUF134 domain-containing protein [Bacteroidales bacterium]MDY0196240.1 DUF134 domain-containing protein [Tenuifilaceae bacterium]
MSPRVRKLRKVLNPPLIKGFKPYGREVEGQSNKEPILLLFEEYEALRLCDYDMYTHHEASVMMGVSRPTFTRIYARVRQKIAKAFVEGHQISIEGGKVYFDSDWHQCHTCKCYFNNPFREIETSSCPLCGNNSISSFDIEAEIMSNTDFVDDQDVCICIDCGYEKPHKFRVPCSQEICPKCNAQMKRK